jgi:MarR family transcriptional regulator, transcriptional regulator for hemolysin
MVADRWTLLAVLILRVYSSHVNELPCPARPEMVMMLLRTAERVERVLERALEGIGLSPAKLAVLGGLASAGGCLSLGDLAQHRSCVKSNITKLVDRLEVDGLVARRDDPTDRRGVLAEITSEGRRLHAEGERLIGQVEEALTRDLAGEDAAALRRVLHEIASRSG